MVSRALSRSLVLAGAVAAMAGGAGMLVRADQFVPAVAPFVSLATGHVGAMYSDQVADGFDVPVYNYRIDSGYLPAGLWLDPGSGLVTGIPAETAVTRLVVTATPTDPSLPDRSIQVSLAILTPEESEVVPGQSFEAPGPCTATVRTETMTWLSSFDGRTRTATVLIYTPDCGAVLMPLLVHHRGRGFSHTDYNSFLGRVASYGVLCATISDEQSFYNPAAPGDAEGEYDGARAELGMESASAAQEALLDYVLGRAADPNDPLYGRIDTQSVFVSGHSRGGGATQASHVRALGLGFRGAIYFMAYDLRCFNECAPPGVAPAYPIPDAQPRLPSLIFSAERDGDLTYPIADEFIDRARGPTTFVNIYGGCHDFLGDANTYDIYGATIQRDDEQARIASFVTAFIRRWAYDDVSLDSFLYGSDYATSDKIGVASWRRTSPTLLVDDFQSSVSVNALGGDNLTTNLQRSVQDFYPASWGAGLASLNLQHSLMTTETGPGSFCMRLAAAGTQDVSGYGALMMRMAEDGNPGYQLDMWVRLQDSAGIQADVQLSAADGSSTGYLPAIPATPVFAKLNRFVTVRVPIAQFAATNPSIDLTNIDRVEFVLSPSTATASTVVLDDVRFE